MCYLALQRDFSLPAPARAATAEPELPLRAGPLAARFGTASVPADDVAWYRASTYTNVPIAPSAKVSPLSNSTRESKLTIDDLNVFLSAAHGNVIFSRRVEVSIGIVGQLEILKIASRIAN